MKPTRQKTTRARRVSWLTCGATPGFGRTISGSSNSKLVIYALSGSTDVRVVSSPQLLMVNGGAARLHVGDQVPIVTLSSSTSVTDVARIVNEIEYRDTGVTLHGGIRCLGKKSTIPASDG